MKYRTNAQEVLFFIVFSVYIIISIAGYTVFNENAMCATAFKALRYLCYLGAVIKVLRDCYREKQIWGIFLVIACVLATVLKSESQLYLFYFLMIFAAKDINANKLVKITCWIQGILLLLIVGLSQLGILSDYMFDTNSRMRHGLGFTWASHGSTIFFFFIMAYVYLRNEKATIYEYAVLSAINYWLYQMTDARMGFYLSTLFLIYVFVMKYYWQNRKEKIRKNKVLVLAPAFFCVVALVLHMRYDKNNALFASLNQMLSGRLELGFKAMEKYGLTLFGQPILWVGHGHGASAQEYNYVDSSYLQILFENGVISLVLVVLLYTYIMYRAIKIKDFYLQSILLCILVFSVTEPRLFNLSFNIFPFFAVTVWAVKDKTALWQREHTAEPRVRFQMSRIRLKKRC